MSHTNKRGRNREVVTHRLNAQTERRRAPTEAEFYLHAGKSVRQSIRRGYSPRTIADALGMTVVEALSALHYAEGPPALILRALVEEWSWQQIKASRTAVRH